MGRGDGERLSRGGLADWQGLLQRQPIEARQILKKLVEGRLVFDPVEDGMAAGYRIGGQATRGRLPAGVRWCPRGDSNTRHAV